MSEFTGSRQLVAGNTNQNLSGIDRDEFIGLPSAADLDVDAAEKAAKDATSVPSTVGAVTVDIPESIFDDPLDNENTFDVSRAEFTELQDAFIRLTERINKFNLGAPHKI